MKSVFLPLGDKNNNYTLLVVVTVKNKYEKTSTNVSTQVCHLSVIVYFEKEDLGFLSQSKKQTDMDIAQ